MIIDIREFSPYRSPLWRPNSLVLQRPPGPGRTDREQLLATVATVKSTTADALRLYTCLSWHKDYKGYFHGLLHRLLPERGHPLYAVQ